ncbi:lipoyltransferase 1, mitochondrial [Platysternon megacephalum]|uniref:Lipoyltransferase 1, mitochondrial n=1 Tax=Platysternon megacephalum TaxID=55544 RepID=A0A4D9E8I9_9SAUR|nr:lipoyltransferase 1, mitochondrial [Platysternon megacephalum]
MHLQFGDRLSVGVSPPPTGSSPPGAPERLCFLLVLPPLQSGVRNGTGCISASVSYHDTCNAPSQAPAATKLPQRGGTRPVSPAAGGPGRAPSSPLSREVPPPAGNVAAHEKWKSRGTCYLHR